MLISSEDSPRKASPLEGSVIQSIILVDEVTRSVDDRFESASLPGHLLHLIVEGEIEQAVSGRKQRVGPGVAVWYYENESVRGRILRPPWTFLTVNFFAARLPPPPFEQRVWRVSDNAFCVFRALLHAWRDQDVPRTTRHLRVYSLLGELLLEVLNPETLSRRCDLPAQYWWEIEAKLREDLSQPISLDSLAEVSGGSQRSIMRACELATGLSPMKRVKELRMSYARGLVLYSKMSMTEIAMNIGYGRVQEFSRDYHARFGRRPRDDRKEGQDYRIQQRPEE